MLTTSWAQVNSALQRQRWSSHPGYGCKEWIQPPGETGPESSFHTERLMSCPLAVSFKQPLAVPFPNSARETGVIVFLAFSTEHCAEFRSWNPVNINSSSNYFYETSCSSPINEDWGGRGWCLSHSYSFLAGAMSGSVSPGLEKHLMELQQPPPPSHCPSQYHLPLHLPGTPEEGRPQNSQAEVDRESARQILNMLVSKHDTYLSHWGGVDWIHS